MVFVTSYHPEHADDVKRLADKALGAGYFEISKMTTETGVVAKAGPDVVGFLLFELGNPSPSLTTIVVADAWRQNGVGLSLASEALARHPDKIWMSPAWISGFDIPADRLLRRLGFYPSHTVQRYWFNDSIKRGYSCPDCGNPCRCDAMIYRRDPANG